jgi:hypothetical protein
MDYVEAWTPAAATPLVIQYDDGEDLGIAGVVLEAKGGNVFLVRLPDRLAKALARLSDRVEVYEHEILAGIIQGALEKVRP